MLTFNKGECPHCIKDITHYCKTCKEHFCKTCAKYHKLVYANVDVIKLETCFFCKHVILSDPVRLIFIGPGQKYAHNTCYEKQNAQVKQKRS